MSELIKAIDNCVANPNEMPDSIVVAILANDLKECIFDAHVLGFSTNQIADAIRHVSTHVTGLQIKAVVKKWGRK